MKAKPPALRRAIFHLRTQLVLALALGGLLALALPASLGLVPRLLIGWDAAVLAHLALVAKFVAGADHDSMRHRARTEDEGRGTILVLVCLAVVASLLAIVAELAGSHDGQAGERALSTALAVVTVMASWLLMQVTFALHYAHQFYSSAGPDDSGKDCGGIEFPGEPAPDYLDFLYMACIIGTAAQTADVSFRSRATRRVGLLHSMLAFFYNTAVLALVINITAALLG